MRRPLIAANWKMHNTAKRAVDLASALKPLVGPLCVDRDVVLFPPFTCLQAVGATLEGGPIAMGAQNMHWDKEGAYTGEVSAEMILTSGCTYVILGHSERRQYFGETCAAINRKAAAALQAGLIPIICVGESLEQRNFGQIEDVVLGQVEAALAGLPDEDACRIVLAYEPVWAIGTGKTASAAQAETVHRLIRRFLGSVYGGDVAARTRIQYGGSVKPENAADLFSREEIDGGLIGAASLSAEDFTEIVKAAGR